MKISKSVRDWYKAMGAKGGRMRSQRLSKARRKEIASLGGIARKKAFDERKKGV